MFPEEALGQLSRSCSPGARVGSGRPANKDRKAKASSAGERAVQGPDTQHRSATWPSGSESSKAPSLSGFRQHTSIPFPFWRLEV